MAAHVRKRPYQPSNQTTLNSYFRQDGDSINSQRSTSPMSPPLPADTAASLLNVGMRVRKSVPEGYKTHKTLGTPGFPFPSSAPPASSAPARPSISPMQTRELTPFCGLHKIGGLAVQDTPSSSAPGNMQRQRTEPSEEDMPDLSMSQGTISSTQNSFASVSQGQHSSTRKRTYEDEIEDDMDDFFDEIEADNGVTTLAASKARPMAPMKGSSQKAMSNSSVRIFGSDDFEEASFLAPLDSMELDR